MQLKLYHSKLIFSPGFCLVSKKILAYLFNFVHVEDNSGNAVLDQDKVWRQLANDWNVDG